MTRKISSKEERFRLRELKTLRAGLLLQHKPAGTRDSKIQGRVLRQMLSILNCSCSEKVFSWTKRLHFHGWQRDRIDIQPSRCSTRHGSGGRILCLPIATKDVSFKVSVIKRDHGTCVRMDTICKSGFG